LLTTVTAQPQHTCHQQLSVPSEPVTGHTKTGVSASVLDACAAQAWPHHFDNAEGAQAFLDSFDWPDGILPEPLPGVKLGSPSSRPAWYPTPHGLRRSLDQARSAFCAARSLLPPVRMNSCVLR
jgi:hypothetical protein